MADGGVAATDLAEVPPVLAETSAGLALSGALTLRTVASVFRDATPLLERSARAVREARTGATPETPAALEIDLAGVGRSDSAALAVLVQWRRVALDAGARLTFKNAPPQLLAIARVCTLDRWLLGTR